MSDVAVVIPAAGRGTRMRTTLRKPFLALGGQPILFHTLNKFAEVDEVGEIVLVVHPNDLTDVKTRYGDALEQLGVTAICPGGEERQQSVYRGLLRVSSEAEIVLIHDAVRPFVTPEVILATIDAARTHGAAIAAVPVKDTVKEARPNGQILCTRSRDHLWLAQTPQGFRRELILRAYRQIIEWDVSITDDAQAVEMLGAPVHLVEGSYVNIKITTPEDLLIAKALLGDE